MTPTVKHIEIPGEVTLYCEIWGKGPPILLLHGNHEDGRYFQKQVESLSRHFTVITIDSRGHGHSSHGNRPLNFDLFADDVIAVLDHLQIEQAHVLGFSDGGSTAISLALRYPERVNRLILNGANIHPGGVKSRYQIPCVLTYYALTVPALLSRKLKRYREIVGLMVKFPHYRPEQLCTIPHQTLVIVGENDMIKDSHSRLIADSIPKSELITIEGGDHFIAAKKPHIFNKRISDFLLKP